MIHASIRKAMLVGALTAVALLLFPGGARAQTFDQYAQTVVSRYSRNFEQRGFRFAQPDYGIPEFTSAAKTRYLMLIASTFRYRAQAGDIRALRALKKGVAPTRKKFSAKPVAGPSFEDSQAALLLVRMMDEVPELVTDDEKASTLVSLKVWLGPSISAPDTENRAVISVANWQYIVNVLRDEGLLTSEEQHAYSARLKNKIDAAVRVSVTSDNWYRESGMFSAHYHAVTAFHLLAYGTFSGQPAYTTRALAMYRNLKVLAFKNGMIEARVGNRPIGLGAQFYTMMAALGFASKDADASVFLNYAAGSRFFSDPRYPNRLEFHQTIEGSSRRFQDDIAVTSVTELVGTFAPSMKRIPISTRRSLSIVQKTKTDRDFSITNSGTAVMVADRKQRTVTKILLGSFGNWTKTTTRAY